MDLTIVYRPTPVIHSDTVENWKKSNESYSLHTSFDSVPKIKQGLFGGTPSVLISVENFTVANIKELDKKVSSSTRVLLVSSKKSTANLSKYTTKIEDLSLPKDARDKENYLVEELGLSQRDAQSCVFVTSNDKSLVCLAQQYKIKNGQAHISEVIDPFRGELPPWGINDGITTGNAVSAIESAKQSLAQGTKPQSLMFQLIGYMRSLVVVKSDVGKTLQGKNIKYLKSKSSGIVDIDGLIKDMSTYPELVLYKSSTAHYALFAMIASMSSRFKRRW